MVPTLIILVLIALGVAGVVWYNRRTVQRPYDQRLEQDVTWNDPTTPDETQPTETPRRPDTTSR